MSDPTATVIYRRISRLRWQAPLLALALVLLHQYVEHTWLHQLPRWQHFASQVLFYGLVGPLAAWWALTSLRRSVRETDRAQLALETAHAQLQKANRRLSFLIRVNRRLAEAEDEEALLEVIVSLPQKILPAAAVSIVPLDEHQRLRPPLFRGRLDSETIDLLSHELLSDDVRDQCASCAAREAKAGTPCRLLSAAMQNAAACQVYCFPLARGERRYGLLNIYLDRNRELTANERSLLKALTHEASLALESQQLRTRELRMLVHLQQASWWRDLEEDLAGVLAHTAAVVEADGGLLIVNTPNLEGSSIELTVGQPLGDQAAIVRNLAESSYASEQRLVIRDLDESD
ncbi:MAG: GAF domain-containing protein, partial [Candidatus Promineifilaceae bacterium]|nr:GAF domain-containing protein [Candidatus Promineifilaceae bacterium]